jgi:hypothetical protein
MAGVPAPGWRQHGERQASRHEREPEVVLERRHQLGQQRWQGVRGEQHEGEQRETGQRGPDGGDRSPGLGCRSDPDRKKHSGKPPRLTERERRAPNGTNGTRSSRSPLLGAAPLGPDPLS